MTTFRETPNWLPGSTKISKNEKWVINYTSHTPKADIGNFIDIKKNQIWIWIREYNDGKPTIITEKKNTPKYLLNMLDKLFK